MIHLYLGLLLFSFLITGILVVPFINILYKLKFQRQKQTTTDFLNIRTLIFDKFHNQKSGTPVGGGLLIIICTGMLLINSTGKIESLGTKGGSGRTTHNNSLGGGGSGGGSINIFHNSINNLGMISATGGLGGNAYNAGQMGGKGGDGCITIDKYNF